MKIVQLSKFNQKEVIKATLTVLKAGGLVVFPTDTVYGLLCDATNPKAVDKLLSFKGRPVGKAISVFMADEKMAVKYVQINQNAKNIINNLLPGPFTVVCLARSLLARTQGDSLQRIDPRLEAENNTLGFRIPDYPLILTLVRKFGRPVTATSANLSSRPPHHSIESFLKSLDSIKKKKILLINLIVDAGKLPHNKPSTVIDTTSGQLKTLRFGDLLPATPNSLISKSEKQTFDLAGFILSKVIARSSGKPVVFLLRGNLGTGKTIFTKGLAKALGIEETVVSPTFTISCEYKIPNGKIPVFAKVSSIAKALADKSTKFPQLSTDKPIKNSRYCDTKRLYHNSITIEQESKTPQLLVHYDFYRLESESDLKEIRFLENIKPGNLYSVEWPEKIDQPTISKLKKTARVIYVKIDHLSKNRREISWSN
ncbi:threonylcarbamoyl-AMP synthase [Candidatus Shapirobacteria bacterium CG03_land_8_20_14_0_80_40_19]|uniref:L-threonylcarbamoyladenylate synthase n=3 Tax=Candidatus Shapironibacteriota TaxID=1752721 RepID=A0A2M7BFC3_9BACT|nr:MAG: threonylcarbamoyl-AMP synthase [Candidatus Shapirobacteria bacterium CG11_big_fil_rev_8_21_14_0_20_40_12]PIV01825.1 MAG: threonylcarbamoyl-AMP synthase [Candidatus Shapirobacteria bacterium CG03_land_8_20_14_0_80_40_19]PJC76542.1 MAG: threonylcarbamoyl-AMP synthase [Candidatus Shapirobacteria bacterium CG_4_8_14_3_um_filter_39_11]